MNYTLIKNDNIKKEGIETVSYKVYEGEKQTAEFSYHTQVVKQKRWNQDTGSYYHQFWIDGISLCHEFAHYETMDSILQFIQYKCWAVGCNAMHVRLNVQNLFYHEMYMKYGFYLIAQEEKQSERGVSFYENVLKYPLPNTREAQYQDYLKRKS